MSKTILDRAFGYPYAAPDHDFVLHGGEVRPLPADADLSGRSPVLGVGSNRAPEQLIRKFGPEAEIPVTVARLADHDVVYSAHMASYGSIPATLAPSPGTIVTVSLTWLTPDQIVRMHETEALGVNYDYGEAADLRIEHGREGSVGPVGCYIGRRGGVAWNGAHVALAEVEAEHRVLAEAAQPDMLDHVHRRHGTGQEIESWLATLVGDAGSRRDVTAKLAREALPISLPSFRILPS